MKTRRVRPLSALLALSLLVVGCGTSPRAQHYLLRPGALPPVSKPGEPNAAGALLSVSLATFPAYLDRPQIVTRRGDHQAEIAEFQRWAEPLDKGFLRLLVSDLARQLPGRRVLVEPLPASLQAAHRVRVELLRFDGVLGQEAFLEARWVVIQPERPNEMPVRRFARRAPVNGNDYADLVAALSRLGSELATEIAQAIPK